MCYHYRPATDKNALRIRFDVEPDINIITNGMTNGYSYPEMPVIMDGNPKVVALARWGLVPGWAKEAKEFLKKSNTLNAMIETAGEKPSFKNYVGNRCLVLAEAFKEWKHETVNGKLVKTPYEITTADGSPFAMAGIYSIWNGEPTFSILTTEANQLMAEIHNSKKRMPVVLCRKEERLWLGREPLEPYCNRSEVELIARAV